MKMVEKFLCPGCTRGHNLECLELTTGNINGHDFYGCNKHSAGTFILGQSCLALGLPVGFNKLSYPFSEVPREKVVIRLWTSEPDIWDMYNVPVWKKYEGGYTFVRTVSPRINQMFIDIIEGEVTLPNVVNITGVDMD